MVQVIENEFTLYDFTDDEFIFGSTYTELQMKFIRHSRGQAAIEKCNIPASGLEKDEFAYRHEYLRGMLAAFDLLLQSHDTNAKYREMKEAEAAAHSAPVIRTD